MNATEKLHELGKGPGSTISPMRFWRAERSMAYQSARGLVVINARMLRLNTARIPEAQEPETSGDRATSKGVNQEPDSRKAS